MSAPTSPPPGAAPRRPARARPRPRRLAAVLATGAVLCSALVALSPGSPASAVSPTEAAAARPEGDQRAVDVQEEQGGRHGSIL
ncbi:hypothetical protein ACWD4I_36275, partial [Streptomyces sp. NPDC002535]